MQSTPNGARSLTLRSILLVLVPVAACLALRMNELPVGAVSDDAYYIEAARSLSEGKGPVLDHGPPGYPATVSPFPAGFPVLLTPVAALYPDMLAGHKIVPVLALLGVLWLCGGSWSPVFGPVLRSRRIAATMLVGINPWVVAAATRVVSELPFTFWMLLAGSLYVRWRTRGTLSIPGQITLIVATALTVLTRTIGVAFLIAIALDLILDRQWKGLARWLGPVLLVWTGPLWMGWPAGRAAVFGDYTAQVFARPGGLPGKVQLAAGNLAGYLEETARVLVPGFPSAVPLRPPTVSLHWGMTVLALVLGTVLVIAVASRLASKTKVPAGTGPIPRARFWGLFLVLYLVALMSFSGYPSGVQPRLLVPLVPLFTGWLVGWMGGMRPRSSRVAFAVVLILAAGHNAWRVALPLGTTSAARGQGFVDPSQGATWVRSQLPEDAVIAVHDPVERHLHFRRATVGLEPEDRRRAGWIFLGPGLHEGPRYVPGEDLLLFESLSRSRDRYTVAYHDSLEAVTVFSVAKESRRLLPESEDLPGGEPNR